MRHVSGFRSLEKSQHWLMPPGRSEVRPWTIRPARKAIAAFGATLYLSALVGCQAPNPGATEYAVHAMGSVGREATLAALEAAIVEQGLTVEFRDATAGSIRAVPLATKIESERPLADQRLSSPQEQRTVIEARLAETPNGVDVYCRARVERLVTHAYRLATESRRPDDRPGVTPIEEEAGTTAQQNAVWQFVRRDRLMERAILDAVSAKITATSPAP